MANTATKSKKSTRKSKKKATNAKSLSQQFEKLAEDTSSLMDSIAENHYLVYIKTAAARKIWKAEERGTMQEFNKEWERRTGVGVDASNKSERILKYFGSYGVSTMKYFNQDALALLASQKIPDSIRRSAITRAKRQQTVSYAWVRHAYYKKYGGPAPDQTLDTWSYSDPETGARAYIKLPQGLTKAQAKKYIISHLLNDLEMTKRNTKKA